MKKRIPALLLVLLLLISGCVQTPPEESTAAPCQTHTDADGNGVCDVCGSGLPTEPELSAPACQSHTDTDNNGVCDSCSISVLAVVDFYTINDLHGKLADGISHPGVDELTTYLKNAKKTDDHVILLSAGDTWQGSSESNLTHGSILTEWMNEMDFAAMALGNHEYDWGEDAIEANAELAEFPFLAINVYSRNTNQRVDYCESSVMVDCGDVQIGIIGAIGDCYSSISSDQTKGVYFKTGSQLTALVKDESEKLRGEGADFIVYVLHDGFEKSQTGSVTGSQLSSYYDISLSDGYVDLVFEGHTHRQYSLEDEYGVYHLQGGGDNDGITHAEVQINFANGAVSVREADTVPTRQYEQLEGDPLIEDLLNKYADEISVADRIVGTNRTTLNRDAARRLIADLYYQAGVERWGGDYDIVLGGGFISIRDPGYLAAGEVTYGMLQSLFPFDNDIVLCSVKGSDLKSKFFDTTHYAYFISYGEYGEQVKKDLDPNGTYYIIVDSYTSSYGPNHLTEIARYDAGVYARDLLAEYIANGGLS